jgi:hypothetical protein
VRTSRSPQPALGKEAGSHNQVATSHEHRFIETTNDHERTARQQLDRAIVLLEAFRQRPTILTSSTLGTTIQLLQSCARHLGIAEEWSA